MAAQEYRVFDFVITTGNTIKSTATVTLGSRLGKTVKTRYGDGPIDAAYEAINKALRVDLSRSFESSEAAKAFWAARDFDLTRFDIAAVTEGSGSIGKSTVELRYGENRATGEGLDNDIVYASIKAYMDAMNKLVPHMKSDIEEAVKAGARK